jgi:glutamine amidotransferase
MITIIDYNMGNIASIENILKRIGSEAIVTSNPSVLQNADKIILPGVGSFDYGMRNLHNLGLIDVLKEKVIKLGTPILGICLGMQLLTEDSEEGMLPGLGFFKAHTKKFPAEWNGQKQKIPHMGWNYINAKADSPLFKNSSEGMRFYFVHSYYVECENLSESLAITEYGNDFTSVIGRDKILGVQFHPEKSHKYGMNLLRNFAEMV